MLLLSLGVPQTVSCLTQHHVDSIGHCGTDMTHKQIAHHDTSRHLNLFKVLPLLLKVVKLHFSLQHFFLKSSEVNVPVRSAHQRIIYVQSTFFLLFLLTRPL